MSPRKYRMSKRAAAAAETRDRIVQATMELHAERGIADTSLRDIAERADVAIGTVYHHFPTYDEAILACGTRTLERWPLPDETVFAGASDPLERLARLIRAIYTRYDEFPGLELVHADRLRFPTVEAFFREEQAQLQALLRAALVPRRPAVSAIRTSLALLSFEFYLAQRRAGSSLEQATEEVVRLVRTLLIDDN